MYNIQSKSVQFGNRINDKAYLYFRFLIQYKKRASNVERMANLLVNGHGSWV